MMLVSSQEHGEVASSARRISDYCLQAPGSIGRGHLCCIEPLEQHAVGQQRISRFSAESPWAGVAGPTCLPASRHYRKTAVEASLLPSPSPSNSQPTLFETRLPSVLIPFYVEGPLIITSTTFHESLLSPLYFGRGSTTAWASNGNELQLLPQRATFASRRSLRPIDDRHGTNGA